MNFDPNPDDDNKTRILLVDNHPQKRPDLERALNQPGYAFVKVCSSVEGFRRLIHESFALILLHVISEVDEAVDLIKRFARICDIPVLVV